MPCNPLACDLLLYVTLLPPSLKRSQWWPSAASTEGNVKFQILLPWSECCDLWMLCPHINHINISLHHGAGISLRGTCPWDIRNGLWSSSVNSVAPENSGNISKAVNKGEDTCLPPGNELQKPAGGKLEVSKKEGKIKNKNPLLLDLQYAKSWRKTKWSLWTLAGDWSFLSFIWQPINETLSCYQNGDLVDIFLSNSSSFHLL